MARDSRSWPITTAPASAQRRWAPRLSTARSYASHKASWAKIGPPNDVGFENFDYPTVSAVRNALETLGIGYGVETSQPGRFYEYPGDPLASGLGTPVDHTQPH